MLLSGMYIALVRIIQVKPSISNIVHSTLPCPSTLISIFEPFTEVYVGGSKSPIQSSLKREIPEEAHVSNTVGIP
jgi:hypothetical protein